MKKLLILVILGLLIGSGKAQNVLEMMKQEEAGYEEWTNDSMKTVVFMPMVHMAKSEFYEDVRQKTLELKSKGYVIFYEWVRKTQIPHSVLTPRIVQLYTTVPAVTTRDPDTLANLVYLLKLRRLTGIIPDSMIYRKILQKVAIFKNLVFQPPAAYFGATATDLNVDVTLQELIDFYEAKEGPIVLEQIDFAIPPEEPLDPALRVKPSDSKIAIIDYRDENLAREIHISTHKKIVVLYGALHKSGTFEYLRNWDGSWRKLDPGK